jgi:hypothetical protein
LLALALLTGIVVQDAAAAVGTLGVIGSRATSSSSGGGSSPAFVPPHIANVLLWLKPESLTNRAGIDPVTFWPDSGTRGNDLANPGGSPTYGPTTLNSIKGVVFDGIADKLDKSSIATSSTTYTMFLVAKFNSAAGTESVIRVGENGGYGFIKGAGNREVLHRLVADCVDGAATTSAELWSATRISGPDLLRFFVNGVENIPSNDSSAVNAPDGVIIHLGRFGASGLYFGGVVWEAMIYDDPQADLDRETVETYLIAKYAL